MFRDREDAGQQLAEKLKKYQKERPLILALPRGGVPIGHKVAQQLNAPLDVFVVRKIGLPENPEFGVGAVAPDVLILDEASLHLLGVARSDMEGTIARETQELNRRLQLYRGGKDFPNIADKTVILVDDGIATGVTVRAALQAIQRFQPRKLILAVPVSSPKALEMLKEYVDELICLEIPSYFYAVGAFYLNFSQVSDEEVLILLKQSHQSREGASHDE